MNFQIIDINHHVHPIHDSLFILVCIDSLRSKKGQLYHDLWMVWNELFASLRIPIWILTRDSPEDNLQIKSLYHSQLKYATCIDLSLYQQLHAYKIKEVFSKPYAMVYPYAYIIYDHHIYKTIKRMNMNTICDLYLAVLDIKYRKFVSDFKAKIKR